MDSTVWSPPHDDDDNDDDDDDDDDDRDHDHDHHKDEEVAAGAPLWSIQFVQTGKGNYNK